MSKIISAFPQIRLAIYGVASATLAGLVIAGVVTEGQSNNILNYVGLGLGAIATLLAAQNVSKPVATPPTTIDEGGDLIASIPGVNPSISRTVEQVQAAIAPTVDEIRAQVERQLGHRPGGS